MDSFDIIVQSNNDVLANLDRLICIIEPAVATCDVNSLYPSIFHTQASVAIKCFGRSLEYDGNYTNCMTDSFGAIQETAYSKHKDTNLIAKQIKGIAMGACDSPYDANLTLLWWEFRNIAKIS